MDLDGNKMVGLVNPIIMTVETVWETPIITGFVHRNSCAAWQQSRCNCDPSSGAWHSRAIWCCRYRVRARRNKDQTIPAHHKTQRPSSRENPGHRSLRRNFMMIGYTCVQRITRVLWNSTGTRKRRSPKQTPIPKARTTGAWCEGPGNYRESLSEKNKAAPSGQ